MNSRICTSILRDSSHLCDHHMVIVKAEEQYKSKLKKLQHTNDKLFTPLKKGGMSLEKCLQRKSSAVTGRTVRGKQDRTHKSACLKNLSLDQTTTLEVAYLLDGVEKFGTNWNNILWSYPFLKGRTNVHLSKKYKQLKTIL
ncbi:hypothetical protein XELAEV_18024850mg [Xenopus laevis]|uniref:Myb-like domain-containing protein n=1 Tax=Xenopus laevis TaxID=8355 RepID=A0A974CZP1_XENLA|nr:hypothetical protein XELAEV_18024850mg [Xenopus laevis]